MRVLPYRQLVTPDADRIMTFLNVNMTKRYQGVVVKLSFIAAGLIVCNVLMGYYSYHTVPPMNLLDFFPEAGGDGSRITWAHGTNNKNSLDEALFGKTMILEADVSTSGLEDNLVVPIMAHPPTTVSDLTLNAWLTEVVKHRKGIKLNFKHIEVVAPSIGVIRDHLKDAKYPVQLCADILPGPTNPISVPLDPATFLRLAQDLPNSMFALGWTTFLDPNDVPRPAYTRHMVDDMVAALRRAEVRRPVTFSVRGCIAKNSVQELKYLLDTWPGSTLTVWSSQGDPVTTDDLLHFRHNFGVKEVYYDLSSPLREEFLQTIPRLEFRRR